MAAVPSQKDCTAPTSRPILSQMAVDGFAETLAAAQRGDEQAFSALWRDNQPRLLRFCRTLGGPDADDVTSETWLAVLGQLARFRGDEAAFRGWLFTIARRKLIDRQRRERPERRVALDEATPADLALSPDAEHLALESLGTQAALALLGQLPREQAEVILLRVVAGLDVAQVARIVGKQPGAVRVSAHRGLRRLAELLTKSGVTETASTAFPAREI